MHLSQHCYAPSSCPPIAWAGFCMSCCICRHIVLPGSLVLSSCRLVVHIKLHLLPYHLAQPLCPLITPADYCILHYICCPKLLRCLLCVASHLLPYHLSLPSCPLVLPTGCCMLHHICCLNLLSCPLVLLSLASCPIMLHHLLVLLYRLVVICCIVTLCLALPSCPLAALLVWFLLVPPVYDHHCPTAMEAESPREAGFNNN